MTKTPDIWMLHTSNPREGESAWGGCYIVEADAHNDAATMRKVTGLDWEVVPMVRADSLGECLHQIAEPQADEVFDEREEFVNWLHGTYPLSYTIIQAADLWFHKHVAALAWKARAAISAAQHQQELAAYRFTVENREARIAELEAELEAVGAGGVQRLAIAPQPCSRSHPHEEMTPMCELRTEIARLTNALARAEAQLAAAPQAVQAVAWLAEYVDREGNSKWYVSTHKDLATENDMNAEPKPLYTHPTQQGLDAQALKQSFREYLSVSEHIDAGGHAMDSIATDLTRIVLAEEEVSAVIARRVHCNTSGQAGEDAANIRAAAQAKQGEQA